MTITVEIGLVRSSRTQRCRVCGQAIPVGTECVKTTQKRNGSTKQTLTWYTCMECERGRRPTDTCVCCGEPVPEGRQVCPQCERRV